MLDKYDTRFVWVLLVGSPDPLNIELGTAILEQTECDFC